MRSNSITVICEICGKKYVDEEGYSDDYIGRISDDDSRVLGVICSKCYIKSIEEESTQESVTKEK